MAYKDFSEIINQARQAGRLRPAVVAGAAEAHVLESILRAWKDRIILPWLVGGKEKILALLKEIDETFPEQYIVDCPGDEAAVGAAAVDILRQGRAAFLVKGLIETSTMLRALLNKETGLPAGRLATHLTLVSQPGYPKVFGLTDAAIVPAPDLEQKRVMLLNAVEAMQALGYERPKVAVVTAVEKVNPKMPETVDAGRLKEMWLAGEIAACEVEGPISFDLAFNRESAKIKGFKSDVAGEPDLLLLPGITSANILVKALGQFSGATTAGVVLGAKVPMVLSSRGSSVQNKYTAAVIVSEMSAN